LEAFGEFSSIAGEYWTDVPPQYDVNHKINYFGLAPNLTLNLKVTKKIILFAESRLRIGRIFLTQKQSLFSNRELYPNKQYWLSNFDFLNAMGVRFEL